MKKETGRELSLEELQYRRKEVIHHYKSGMRIMKIVETVGLTWPTVRKLIDAFEENGISAIKVKKPGVRTGDRRMLTASEEKEIQKLIIDKRPEQLKLNFALWNRKAVSLLIEEKFGKQLAVRTIGTYLKRWGFTPQKPIKKAYEQNPKAVEKWLNETYPSIKERAHKESAEIQWADETALMNNDVRGRGYAPKGKTPVAYHHGGSRKHLSMISSVTNQGKVQWMITDGAFNSDRFIDFLKQLIKDASKKVFLVVDNLRVHHSKPVKEWVEQNSEQIELFFLPSYSPELNPDERLNADLKYAIGSAKCARTPEKLKENTVSHMNLLEKSPGRVKAYFQDKYTTYAS